MEQLIEISPTVNFQKKPPLFQQWMQANPELHPFIRPKEWFVFLQFIVKSLKAYDGEEVDDFLEKQIPKLFKNEVPFSKVSDAFTYLRFLLLKHILDDPSASQENKDHSTIRLVSFFDHIFRLVREKYPTEAEIAVETIKTPQPAAQPEVTLLKFHIEENRFIGKGHLDTALAQWLGIGVAQASSFSKWKSVIHPEDVDEVQSALLKLIQKRCPIYEMVYRLRHHSGEWREVVELGKINYDEKGESVDFVGVVIEKSEYHREKTVDDGLPQILDYILNSKTDIAFIIDKEARLVHVTRALLKYLIFDRGPLFNPANWVNLGEPFFELLDDENKIIAKNFWGLISPLDAPAKKLLLKLRHERRGKEKIVEFSPIVLDKTLHTPHYILWGQVVPRRRSADVFNERMVVLAGLGDELSRLSDLNSFYKKVLETIQLLIPAAQAAAILVKSPKGFEYSIGFGYKNNVLYNKLILETGVIPQLKETGDQPKNAESRLIEDQLIKNQIREKLSEPPFNNINANGKIDEGDQQIVGLINAGSIPYAILELNTFGSREYFTESDKNTLKLALQQTSFVLSNHLLLRKLQENEINYSAVLEKSPVAVFVFQDEKIKLANHKLLNLLGLEAEENRPIDIWLYVHPDDLAALKKKLHSLSGQSASLEHEFRLLGADREERYCSGMFQRIFYNNRPAVMCEILDITRLRRLEQQLLKAQKIDTIGALAMDITHDFNNILAAIIPSAQLIINHPEKISENSNRARMIFHMAQRAASLTRKMLTYSHSEAELPRIFSLNQLIRETQEMLDKMVGPAIKITCNLEENLPEIKGEYNQLVQMLVNLVVNARDAMPKGGEILISTFKKVVAKKIDSERALKPGTYAQLVVQDSGSGIPKEIRQQIFQPFFSTKTAQQRSGLGLSIVYGILKKHNGYVMVQSLEKGSVFKIYLPAVDETAEKVEPKPAITAVQSGSPKTILVKTILVKTILVVDDEKNLRDVFSGMIRFMGYDIMEAGSGAEAIQVYQNHKDKIDLAIIDYAMPGMSGKETYEALKRLNPAVEAILCTGYGEKEEVADLVKSEPLHLLPKPFTIETLEKKIKEAFGNPGE